MIAKYHEEHLTTTLRISYALTLAHIFGIDRQSTCNNTQETSKVLACMGEDATHPKFWNLQLVLAFKGLSMRFDFPSPKRRHAVAEVP